jgi:AbrB family looped-hinge helix DNA binding protein
MTAMPHYEAKISSKGQLRIPDAVREHLDLKPGDIVDFVIDDVVRSVHILVRNKGVPEPSGEFDRPPGGRAAAFAEMDEATGEYVAEKQSGVGRHSIFDRLEELKLPSIGRTVTQADIDAAIGEAMDEQERRIRNQCRR